jgi:hypothetical protein
MASVRKIVFAGKTEEGEKIVLYVEDLIRRTISFCHNRRQKSHYRLETTISSSAQTARPGLSVLGQVTWGCI